MAERAGVAHVAAAPTWRRRLADGTCAVVRCTGAAEGDLAIDVPGAELDARRRAVVDLPWLWLRQVHGADVAVLDDADGVGGLAGAEADGAVSAVTGVALAVHTADCAPVVLVGEGGVLAVAHAGWRGLHGGVVEAAAEAARARGSGPLEAVLGPCICPRCYEFGPDELARVADRLGEGVRSRTATGAPALDLPAAVDAALAGAGVAPATRLGGCTACGGQHWSHRARRDRARQATVAWREPVG